jgi:hypothetical protein
MMGHIETAAHPWKAPNIVAVIEGIIHDHHQLDVFCHQARESLRETGLLPQTRIWDYLHWRRNLDPPRFDFHHPEFVRLFRSELRNLRHMPHHPPTIGGIAEVPIGPLTSVSEALVPAVESPQNPPPVLGPTVPEPDSITLALAAIASGAALVAARWVRRLRGTGSPGRSMAALE